MQRDGNVNSFYVEENVEVVLQQEINQPDRSIFANSTNDSETKQDLDSLLKQGLDKPSIIIKPGEHIQKSHVPILTRTSGPPPETGCGAYTCGAG